MRRPMLTISESRRRFAKRISVIGFAAIGVAACGGGSTSSSTQASNLFDPASFNTSSVPWLAANVNATGTPPSTPTGTLTMAGAPDFSDLLYPQAEYETTGFQVTEAFSRRLVYYPVSSNLVTADEITPDAATSMPTVSSDGLTYTFHIKQGVMWDTNPPRPVTSQDFARGLKQECDPVIAPLGNPGYYSAEIAGYSTYCTGFEALSATAPPSQRAAYINNTNVTGISTPDSSTIVFQLTAPSVDFLNLLAMPFAAAEPAEELNFIPETAGNPLYSDGPYEVSNCTGTSTAANYNDCTGYDVGHTLTLDDNPTWSQSTDTIRHQYLQHIQIKLDLPTGDAGESTVDEEIRAGTTDLTFGSDDAIPTSDLASLSSFTDPLFGAFPAPGTTNPYLVFNVQSGNNNGALKNVKVRQALEYALDKTALTKIYGGTAFNQVLNQVIAPGAQGYTQFDPYPTPNNAGDPSKCKSMLAAAGASNLTLKDYYRTQGNHPAVYEEVKSDFAKCGVTVTGVPISTGYYGSKGISVSASTASAGDAQLAMGAWDITEPGWVPDWFGPSNGRAILPDLFDGAANFPGTDWGGYDNPAVDSLVTQAEAAKSLSQADSLWHQADVKVMADAPFIPFMTQLTPLLHAKNVHNAIWSPFASAFDITNIWVS